MEAAKRLGGSLFAVTVLDPAEPARLASTLDSAFVGERVSDRVIEVLGREQRLQAEAALQSVAELAARAGVPFHVLIEDGDPEEVCRRVIRQNGIGHAILVAERRSWLTRLLSRSAAVKLPALAGCEVRVMEQEES